MDKRAQGRPSRAAGVVGRQKIVDDVRKALRALPSLDVSRKGLAQAIGVTPALITYYFPERDALLEEVAVPVIEQHRIRLTGIVNRSERSDEKLRDIIAVLYELYGIDRSIFAIYATLEERFPEDYAETFTMTLIIKDFFSLSQDSEYSSFEAVALQGAVRRMCEVADRIEKEYTSDHSTIAEAPSSFAWRNLLCRFFAGSNPRLGEVPAIG